MIVVGAVVRVTDSGLGCGDHWPLCNGTIFPPLDNLTAWIEWIAPPDRAADRRVRARDAGDWRSATIASRNARVLVATVVAALLYSVQDALGRAVVLNELNPALVTVHLATAMMLLAALLVAAVLAVYVPEAALSP